MKPVPRDEFARRRRQLMRLMGRDSIAILPAAPVRQRNNDVEYAYRQDSDFFYLTGFAEPEAVAVLVPGREQAEYSCSCATAIPRARPGTAGAPAPPGAARDYGADDAFPIADIDEILPGLLENRDRVFYTMGVYADFDQRIVGWVNGLRTQARNGRHPPQEFVALDHVLHDMRLFKIARRGRRCMRESARIAAARARARDALLPARAAANTRSWRSWCTSSGVTTPTPPITRSSAAARTAASCTTATTTRR